MRRTLHLARRKPSHTGPLPETLQLRILDAAPWIAPGIRRTPPALRGATSGQDVRSTLTSSPEDDRRSFKIVITRVNKVAGKRLLAEVFPLLLVSGHHQSPKKKRIESRAAGTQAPASWPRQSPDFLIASRAEATKFLPNVTIMMRWPQHQCKMAKKPSGATGSKPISASGAAQNGYLLVELGCALTSDRLF